ncbi:MAG: hypothetical protein ACHQXA_11240 [Gemmatimonadales bacterium]
MTASPFRAVGRLAALGLLAGFLPPRLSAQVQWTARLGATASSALVSDQIVSLISIRPSIAPTLLLGGSIPADANGRRFGVELGFTSGSYASKENGTSTDLGTLRTLSATAGFEGQMAPALRWRAALGVLAYLPAERTGIFQDGAPTRILAAAGLEYRRLLRAPWTLTAALRYEYHRFTTQHLQNQGYSGSQDVHRITLAVGVSR